MKPLRCKAEHLPQAFGQQLVRRKVIIVRLSYQSTLNPVWYITAEFL